MNHSLQSAIDTATLIYVVLSHPVKGVALSKVTVRPLKIKGAVHYQVTSHYAQKVTHANYSPDQLLEALWSLLGPTFREGIFFTAEADFYVHINKKGESSFSKKKPTRQVTDGTHNKFKNHVLGEGKPVPFLIELGVMRPDGSLVPKMAHKFRQINRFVEIVADIVPNLPAQQPLNIVDFGCGKSYLTFAIYHLLCKVLKRDVKIIGLDLKADVVAHCQALADKLGYVNLRFQVGDINNHKQNEKVDMVVSLHACDTATDAALEKAVHWQADVILCVPCCQHELYRQVKNDALTPLLKHGILRERFAALATDAARAQILELAGYHTQVMEFIDLEHTPKNLLIRAVRGAKSSSGSVRAEYEAFATSLSIHPSLQKRLLD